MAQWNPLWIVALYALASFVVLFTALSIDPFIIFNDVYGFAAVILPTLLIPGLLIYWRVRFNAWHWALVGLGCLMCVGVSFLHILFIAAASASV